MWVMLETINDAWRTTGCRLSLNPQHTTFPDLGFVFRFGKSCLLRHDPNENNWPPTEARLEDL
jgi:hypothetical protein